MPEPAELTCPACEVGTLRAETGSKEYLYQGQPFVLESAYSVCTECGTEVVTPGQGRANDRLIREEHRRIDGFLSAAEIRAIRSKLHITQHDASLLFGGGLNAFSKYECVEVVQSTAMDRLIRVVDMVPGAFDALVRIAYGASPKVVNVVTSPTRVYFDYSDDQPGHVFHVCPVQESPLSFLVKNKSSANQTYRRVEQYKKAAG